MEEETNQQTNKQKKRGRTDSLPPPKEERARIRYKENQICSIHVSIGVAIIVIGGCNSAVTRTNLKVEMYVPRYIYIYQASWTAHAAIQYQIRTGVQSGR